MDIEKLKRTRRHNVQEQNALTKDRIETEAKFWRERGIPNPLIAILNDNQIDPNECIFLEYEQDFPGISTDEGMIVSIDGKFYRFELDLNKDRTMLVEQYLFKDISDEVEIDEHKPGTGKTWGFLALQVLTEMNQING